MQLEIVSPERVMLNEEVSSVTLPGKEGLFQMLDHHAPIISTLDKGFVRFITKHEIPKNQRDKFFKGSETNEFSIEIKGGVVEMKNNKAIVLID